MKLRDLGENALREWFNQILEWSRKKITIDDNLDCVFVTGYVGTTQTEVGHSLGRVPKYILEVAAFPYGTAGIKFSDGTNAVKEPTIDKIFIARATAGQCTLMLM